MEIIDEKVQEISDGLDEHFPDEGTPYGQKRPTNEEIAFFAQKMLEDFPPKVWVNEETGEVIFDSAWNATLRDDPRVEGGREVWKRINEAVEKAGA